jgi:hypothetical protein
MVLPRCSNLGHELQSALQDRDRLQVELAGVGRSDLALAERDRRIEALQAEVALLRADNAAGG